MRDPISRLEELQGEMRATNVRRGLKAVVLGRWCDTLEKATAALRKAQGKSPTGGDTPPAADSQPGRRSAASRRSTK